MRPEGKPFTPFTLDAAGARILPVLHERLECADAVRLTMAALAPRGVVVEVPSSLEALWIEAIERLPAISVIVYETQDGQTVYLPIHPADPMAEAGRTARDHGLPLTCGDLDVDGYADYRDPAPDPYAIRRLGLGPVYRAFQETLRAHDPLDDRREAAMAYHAQRLMGGGDVPVLVVCGMHHAQGIAGALATQQAIPLTLPVRRKARLVHLHPDSLGEVLAEPPFYVALYEARRAGLPPAPAGDRPEAPGRSYGGFRVVSGGKGDDPERLHAAVVRAARRAGTWDAADDPAGTMGALDRLSSQWALLREAQQALAAAAPDESVQPWQRRNLARFSRNLARMSGMLVADLYDLIVAARGCVSENFAWEVHRLATAYPFQSAAASDAPTARIRADELWDGVRRIRLQRRLRRPKQRGLESLFRRRRRDERYPGEWLQGFDQDAICSYPPEDIVVEEFGRYLKRRGKSILSEERAHSIPFTTSILDGIDVRETLRHWGEKRLWVRELGRVPGEVGLVVVIFDEDTDPSQERFPYRLTWVGENEQESDMAFYATDPSQAIVGPGICRVTYGGLLLSYPPGRLMDVWRDPDYLLAETKAETLLLAALDYSTERIVVHVAAKPPRTILHALAARLNRKILHVPLGTLSPATVRRIRVMHILSGHDKREVAKDYVW